MAVGLVSPGWAHWAGREGPVDAANQATMWGGSLWRCWTVVSYNDSCISLSICFIYRAGIPIRSASPRPLRQRKQPCVEWRPLPTPSIRNCWGCRFPRDSTQHAGYLVANLPHEHLQAHSSPTPSTARSTTGLLLPTVPPANYYSILRPHPPPTATAWPSIFRSTARVTTNMARGGEQSEHSLHVQREIAPPHAVRTEEQNAEPSRHSMLVLPALPRRLSCCAISMRPRVILAC